MRNFPMPVENPIYVTQPYLPDLEEFVPYLREIWTNRILTNGGPFHQQLEQALCKYLDVQHLSLFTNGTIALVTALQALRITGEVITTPYSFVATAHSLLWNGIKPVFVDIDPESLNLDPNKIEAAITPQTTAILAVHVYGNPCNVAAIQHIADRYNLKVIYDAAHAFGVKDLGGGVSRHGDMSVLSFHATKVFNTFEGGAIICRDAKTKKYIDDLKNFGFTDEVTVVAPGINGKMNEFQAALGLLQLQHMDHILKMRAAIAERYSRALEKIEGIRSISTPANTLSNFAYYPILVQPNYPLLRDTLYDHLKKNGINPRRYFYPLISNFPMYRSLASAAPSSLPVATNIANQVLCLPIYPDLPNQFVDKIIRLIENP